MLTLNDTLQSNTLLYVNDNAAALLHDRLNSGRPVDLSFEESLNLLIDAVRRPTSVRESLFLPNDIKSLIDALESNSLISGPENLSDFSCPWIMMRTKFVFYRSLKVTDQYVNSQPHCRFMSYEKIGSRPRTDDYSHIIHNVYFELDEFKKSKGMTILSLCNAIEKDDYKINIASGAGTIEWLNELIRKPELFREIFQKNDLNILDELTRSSIALLSDRYAQTKSESDLVVLNRYLLETYYQLEIPSILRIPAISLVFLVGAAAHLLPRLGNNLVFSRVDWHIEILLDHIIEAQHSQVPWDTISGEFANAMTYIGYFEDCIDSIDELTAVFRVIHRANRIGSFGQDWTPMVLGLPLCVWRSGGSKVAGKEQ